MQITTDEVILFKSGFIVINNTLLYSWIVMGILIFIAFIFRPNTFAKSFYSFSF